MTVRFYTLGCKVNRYETEAMSSTLQAAGFTLAAADAPEVEVIVINSCTVTGESDSKVRKLLHRCRREHPEAVLVLTGCYPQAHPEVADQTPEADIILGAKNRGRLASHIESYLRHHSRIVDVEAHEKGEGFEDMQAARFTERTRATLKIEDGCNRYCSYCIIPTARGPVRSKPLNRIAEEAAAQAAAGYKETVVTGINLTAYGEEIGHNLLDALRIVEETPGIERIRLGSLEPDRFSPAFIQELSRLKKLCPQFHLSLQSGCAHTLRAMNRHYSPEDYRTIVAQLRLSFPGCSITTDAMVGFPGETEEHFAQSLEFVESIGFAKVHVFAYSIRPGTRAADMPEQVTKAVKEQRSRRMIEATDHTRQQFFQNQEGQIHSVLFEQTVSPDVWEGYTPNYTPVRLQSSENLEGKIRNVRIEQSFSEFCTASLDF